jgi:hypothetical protein
MIVGFDGFGDGEVTIGDGTVRDPGVDEGHAHGAMSRQGSDYFEGHAELGASGGVQLTGIRYRRVSVCCVFERRRS